MNLLITMFSIQDFYMAEFLNVPSVIIHTLEYIFVIKSKILKCFFFWYNKAIFWKEAFIYLFNLLSN